MCLFQGQQRQPLHGLLDRREIDLIKIKLLVVIHARRNADRARPVTAGPLQHTQLLAAQITHALRGPKRQATGARAAQSAQAVAQAAEKDGGSSGPWRGGSAGAPGAMRAQPA